MSSTASTRRHGATPPTTAPRSRSAPSSTGRGMVSTPCSGVRRLHRGLGRRAVAVVIGVLSSVPVTAQSPRDALLDSALSLVETGMRAGATDPIDNALALIERLLAASPEDAMLLHYQ